jgi:rRNA maturation endonuclease Nob1
MNFEKMLKAAKAAYEVKRKKDRHRLDECLGCGLLVDHVGGPKTCPKCGGSAWRENAMEEDWQKRRGRYK